MAYSLNNLTKTSVRIQFFGDDLKKTALPRISQNIKTIEMCIKAKPLLQMCVVSR